MNLRRFYKNNSWLCSVKARFILHDLCLVVVAIWQWLNFYFCRYVPLAWYTLAWRKLLFMLLIFLNCFIFTGMFFVIFCSRGSTYKILFSLVISLTISKDFLLMCKLLNTKFFLSKLAARLMFHWISIFIFSIFFFHFYFYFFWIEPRVKK